MCHYIYDMMFLQWVPVQAGGDAIPPLKQGSMDWLPQTSDTYGIGTRVVHYSRSRARGSSRTVKCFVEL